jgi:hypothetical protein
MDAPLSASNAWSGQQNSGLAPMADPELLLPS